MKTSFQPTGPRVLIEPLKASDTKNGIYVGDKPIQGAPVEGIVRAKGAAVTEVDVGDKVLIPPYGTEIKVEGVKCVLVAEEDILAILA